MFFLEFTEFGENIIGSLKSLIFSTCEKYFFPHNTPCLSICPNFYFKPSELFLFLNSSIRVFKPKLSKKFQEKEDQKKHQQQQRLVIIIILFSSTKWWTNWLKNGSQNQVNHKKIFDKVLSKRYCVIQTVFIRFRFNNTNSNNIWSNNCSCNNSNCRPKSTS